MIELVRVVNGYERRLQSFVAAKQREKAELERRLEETQALCDMHTARNEMVMFTHFNAKRDLLHADLLELQIVLAEPEAYLPPE